MFVVKFVLTVSKDQARLSNTTFAEKHDFEMVFFASGHSDAVVCVVKTTKIARRICFGLIYVMITRYRRLSVAVSLMMA